MAILIVKKNNPVKKFCSAAIIYDCSLTLFGKGEVKGKEKTAALPGDPAPLRQRPEAVPEL